VVLAVLLAVLVVAASGVLAALQAVARNTAPQQVQAATLSLTLGDNGAGFSTAITAVAPGDTVQRYVDLTNGGNLAAQALTMSVGTNGVSNPLVVDGTTTRALRVAVNSCSGTWTPSTGACSGTVTSLVAATPLGSLGSPVTLVPGAIAVGQVVRLQIVLTLPDQDEVTTNGVPPATTVQGQTVPLTFTFTERQRAAATTTG
jgi:hypothetical protein